MFPLLCVPLRIDACMCLRACPLTWSVSACGCFFCSLLFPASFCTCQPVFFSLRIILIPSTSVGMFSEGGESREGGGRVWSGGSAMRERWSEWRVPGLAMWWIDTFATCSPCRALFWLCSFASCPLYMCASFFVAVLSCSRSCSQRVCVGSHLGTSPGSPTAAQIQSINQSTRVWTAARDSCRHSYFQATRRHMYLGTGAYLLSGSHPQDAHPGLHQKCSGNAPRCGILPDFRHVRAIPWP